MSVSPIAVLNRKLLLRNVYIAKDRLSPYLTPPPHEDCMDIFIIGVLLFHWLQILCHSQWLDQLIIYPIYIPFMFPWLQVYAPMMQCYFYHVSMTTYYIKVCMFPWLQMAGTVLVQAAANGGWESVGQWTSCRFERCPNLSWCRAYWL